MDRGIQPDYLEGPEMPDTAERSWAWFRDLSKARPRGFGASPIPWADIDAYFTRMEITTRPWEIRLIRSFDDAYLASTAKKEK